MARDPLCRGPRALQYNQFPRSSRTYAVGCSAQSLSNFTAKNRCDIQALEACAAQVPNTLCLSLPCCWTHQSLFCQDIMGRTSCYSVHTAMIRRLSVTNQRIHIPTHPSNDSTSKRQRPRAFFWWNKERVSCSHNHPKGSQTYDTQN